MAFKRPKIEETPEPPNATDPANTLAANRRRRLASGGVASTLIGSMMQGSGGSPGPTVTGVGG